MRNTTYVTHKGTSKGKLTTRARKAIRGAKYHPFADLNQVARELGAVIL